MCYNRLIRKTIANHLIFCIIFLSERTFVMKLYEQIITDIENKLATGVYKINDRIPTDEEMMEIYGVSRVTVRKAMDSLVSRGYLIRKPKKGTFVVQNFVSQKVIHVVLIMMFQANDSLEIIGGVEDYLNTKNIHLTVKFSNCSDKSERDIIEEILTLNVQGVIIYPTQCNTNTDIYYRLCNSDFPVVFLDRYPRRITCSSVMVDDYELARNVVNYLVFYGHRDIVFAAANVNSYISLQDRMYGFCDTMKNHGFQINKRMLQIYPTEEECIHGLLNMKKMPSAVFCCNDRIALRVMSALQSKNLRIPEDISVVGCDDIEMAAYANPPLTTIHQPFREIGRAAGEMISQMLFSSTPCHQKIYLPSQIIERESVAKLIIGAKPNKSSL